MRHIATCSILAVSFSSAAPTLSTNRYISPNSEIKVIFDKAVVSKDKVGSTEDNQLLQIQPKWQGKIYWQDQNIAVFRPAEASHLNTTYSFSTLKAEYLDTTEIPKTVLGKKSTTNFDIQRSYRLDHARNVARPRYFLTFNQDVDVDKILAFFYYKNAQGQTVAAETVRAKYGDIRSSYYTPLSWSKRYKASIAKQSGVELPAIEINDTTELSNSVVVRPISTLPVGKNWTLHVLSGLPTSDKNTKLKGDEAFRVGTKQAFEVKSIHAHTIANEPRFIRIRLSSDISDPTSVEAINKLIQVRPKVKNVSIKVDGNKIDIHGDFSAQDRYRVRLQANLKAVNGLSSSSSKSELVTFKHIEPAMAIPSYSTAQLSKGQRKYPVETVNMKTVRVRVKSLTLEQAVRAQYGYNQFIANQAKENGNTKVKRTPIPYALISGATVHDKVYELSNSIDTSQTLVLDWDKVLPKQRANQIFFLDIEGTAKDSVKRISHGIHHVQTFIQLTDIGLAWKLTKEEALLYCYSCETGKPLSNVNLKLFTNDAVLKKHLTTDVHGIARLSRHKDLTHLTASINGDAYVIPFDDSLDTVSLWRFPVEYSWHSHTGWMRETLIFTDRKLYKPGETVHIKGIVRERKDNDHRIPSLKKASLKIKDASNRLLVEKDITLSSNGTFDQTISLPAHNVGTHSIHLTFEQPESDSEDSENDDDSWERNWIRDRNNNFSAYFSVQEFRKNAFKIKSKIAKDQVKPNLITATINAEYYMGTAVAEGSVDWYLSTKETGFYPAKFRDFYFGDHTQYDPYYWDYYYGYNDGNDYGSNTVVRENGSEKLDKEGKLSLTLALTSPEFPSPQKVSLLTEVTDGRDQTLSSNAALTIHPSSHYLGLARIDSLLRVNQSNNIQLIAVSKDGKASAEDFEATVSIERISYESVKVRSADGRVTVNNTEKNELFKQFTLELTANKETNITFNPTKSGRYLIKVEAKDSKGNRMVTATRYQVYGSNEYPWAVQTGMQIKLAPEQKHYKPGDTARILVMTPIEGTALVTVERSGVIRHYRRDLKASNPVIDIPIDHEDAPNMYVSVLVIRGSKESPRKFKEPALRLGYCNINVKNVRDRLAIELDSPEDSYKPGSTITLSGTIKDSQNRAVQNAEVTFYAEDNGVLDVIGYKMPRPLKYFNKQIDLNVECGTSLHSFLTEEATEDMNMINKSVMNKGYSIGGGGDTGELKKNVRKYFDPCAVWRPAIITDKQGRFSVTFKAPDSLTSYRVMAVAVANKGQFGSADSEFVVNKPLMLQPMAPRFANEGDKTNTKLYIANNSKFDGKWKVTLSSNSLTEFPAGNDLHSTEQYVTLKAGESDYLNFDVHFKNTGKAQWTWSAEPVSLFQQKLTPVISRNLSDSMQSEFNIIYPRPILRDARLHKLAKNRRNLLKPVDPKLLKGRGHIELELSNNLLFKANGAADHLLHYPYG